VLIKNYLLDLSWHEESGLKARGKMYKKNKEKEEKCMFVNIFVKFNGKRSEAFRRKK
jgi:hypothetical protein